MKGNQLKTSLSAFVVGSALVAYATVVFVVALMVFESCNTAHAQDVDDALEVLDVEYTVLTMGQACVGEVDFDHPHECWLMWRINFDVANERGRDFAEQLRAYNSVFKVDNPRSQWVLGLNLAGTVPAGWPATGPRYEWVAEKWGRVLALARHFLKDPGVHPCPAANAYGGACGPNGACDHVPGCWVQVTCHKPGQLPFVQAYYRSAKCRPGEPLRMPQNTL